MPGLHPHSPTPTPALTRREALDTPSRRIRRTLRKRGVLLASGAAVLVVAGGALTVGTQPAIGEAIGMPSASASASATPALSGTALDRAQAAATIVTAKTVVADANTKTDTATLERRIASLSDYRQLSGATISDRIQSTVDTTQDVAQASADQDKQDADAAVAAAQAAAAAAAAQAQADAAAAAAAAQAAANTPTGAKSTAASLASSQYGWGAAQFQCLDSLWTKESGWDYQAYNPSGATGIPQALPGSKMATIASDWQSNATTQVTWGLKYIKDAYGTPCAAWSHSQATNYY